MVSVTPEPVASSVAPLLLVMLVAVSMALAPTVASSSPLLTNVPLLKVVV
jgi:hypothetical protein